MAMLAGTGLFILKHFAVRSGVLGMPNGGADPSPIDPG
jgi:hypothetical protein